MKQRYTLANTLAMVLFPLMILGQGMGFRQLTTSRGLSQSHVASIVMDKKGFMWFGTDDGLNRFDGYNFKQYKHDQSDPGSINDSYVQDLLVDGHGRFWVATSSGLNRFNFDKDRFVRYGGILGTRSVNKIYEDRAGRLWLCTDQGLMSLNGDTGRATVFLRTDASLSSYRNPLNLTCIVEDSKGKLWVGTKQGLYIFDPVSLRYSAYFEGLGNDKLYSNWIKVLYKDKENNIWVGTRGGGLSVLEAGKSEFKSFLNDPADSLSISHNDILSITQDSDGQLWIGTENGGISIFNQITGKFQRISHTEGDNTALSDNSVYCIYRDRINNLWVGTYSGGVNFLSRFRKKFSTYRKTNALDNTLSNNLVLSMCGDKDPDKVWIGTDGGGLNLFDRKTKKFNTYRHNPANKNSPSNDYVISIARISDDTLGLAYHMGGFDFFNTRTKTFTHHLPASENSNSLSTADINNIFKDSQGGIWLGTWNGGLDFYDSKTGQITHYQHDPANKASISSDIVTKVFEDRLGRIWVGTFQGLNQFDRQTRSFRRYQSNYNRRNALSNNKVQTIQQARDGSLWIGTLGGGLNHFDPEKNQFTAFTEKQGLASNVIYGILEDKNGHLWLSTNNGLSDFDPRSKTFRNFGLADGLQGNEFKSNSCFQTQDGEMFFGGVRGFTSFYPDKLTDNTHLPPVYMTEFLLFNKPVTAGKNSPLEKAAIQATQIHLDYQHSVISFEFAALNYTMPEKNKYAYKLEGFDKDWTFSGTTRRATYTNLDPGEYIFRVKAANNDGIWNEEGTQVRVYVAAAFWQTTWFKLGCVALALAILIAIYRIRIRVIKLQKAALVSQVNERTKKISSQKKEILSQTHRLQELNNQLQIQNQQEQLARQDAEKANAAKSVFLATMSHEIRTPMNGVMGMAMLLSQTEQTIEQAEYTDTIIKSGESLLTVINDILDFSKIESGNIELENLDFDLRECIESVLDLFASKAAEIGLDLVYEIDLDTASQITADSHRLRQILINLVGNAIKFTTAGEIFLSVTQLKQVAGGNVELQFAIRDTGIGIPEDKLSKLFVAFSQVDSSHTRKYGGTGLGLIICQRLVGLMGGRIWVESLPGQGSCFYFTINAGIARQPTRQYVVLSQTANEGKSVLIVDDNVTNLRILEMQMQQWKLVSTLASSGTQALGYLQDGKHFDMVITDQQMPGMDGIELAEQIKNLHPKLPIILLSSVGDDSGKNEKALFAQVLTKPVKHAHLEKTVQFVLRSGHNIKALPQPQNTLNLTTDFEQHFPLHILLTEDNAINEKLFVSILRKLGYTPAIAHNGEEACQKAMSADFDIIFMDVQMPILDGLEATRKIRTFDISQPFIIAMTANAMREDKEACLQAGMDHYLSKPLRTDEIKAALQLGYKQKKARGITS